MTADAPAKPPLPKGMGWVIVLLMALAAIVGAMVALRVTREPRANYVAISVDMMARGGLHRALDRTPMGNDRAVVQGRVAMLYTVIAEDGTPCRAFRMLRPYKLVYEGVACRRASQWRVVALAQAPAPIAGFAEEQPDRPPALLLALDVLDPGPPLTPNSERQLMEHGWPILPTRSIAAP